MSGLQEFGDRIHQVSVIAHRTLDVAKKPFKFPTDLDIDNKLRDLGVKTIFSVPCSITDTLHSRWQQQDGQGGFRFIPTSHEHALPGLAAGWYMGSGEIPMIHMQNSGLPNAGDGFISFASVYKIPILALVTWRGDSEKDDSEPHQEIGMRTERLIRAFLKDQNVFGSRRGRFILRSFERAYEAAQRGEQAIVRLSPQAFNKVLPLELPDLEEPIPVVSEEQMWRTIRDRKEQARSRPQRTRVEGLQELIFETYADSAVVLANGYTSRAGQAEADRLGNFYNVGYMGGGLAIGYGLAEANPDIDVFVIDGDQNALMSTMTDKLFVDTVLGRRPKNLHYAILNNRVGASVGVTASESLPDHYYYIADVISTQPDQPKSFASPRIRAVGSYFVDDDSRILAERIGPLPVHQARFREWVEQQSRRNRILAGREDNVVDFTLRVANS